MKLASREVHFILYTGPPVCQAPPERIFFLVQRRRRGHASSPPLRLWKKSRPWWTFSTALYPVAFPPRPGGKVPALLAASLAVQGRRELEAGFRPLELPRLILNHLSLKKRDPQAGRRRGHTSSPPQFTCFQYFLPQLRTFWPNGRCPIKRLRPFHPAQRVSSPGTG